MTDAKAFDGSLLGMTESHQQRAACAGRMALRLSRQPLLSRSRTGGRKMQSAIVGICVLLGICAPAGAAVSIGSNPPGYPDLVPVPGCPVYYAPELDANLFFYNGL